MTRSLSVAAVLLAACAAPVAAQGTYPPVDRYLMPREAEIAMARSAAPTAISDRATVKVLTRTGYEVAVPGSNGVVCLLLRGFAAPTYTPAGFRGLVYDPAVHAPICFAAPAAKMVLPYYELRTTLALAGKHPDQIAEALQRAYVRGELPRRQTTTFAYMFSAHQHLGPGIGAWHPHMMVFVPDATPEALGGAGLAETLPQVSDDAGTPFAVVVIPVDGKQSIRRATN
jgi:hypothetical protein